MLLRGDISYETRPPLSPSACPPIMHENQRKRGVVLYAFVYPPLDVGTNGDTPQVGKSSGRNYPTRFFYRRTERQNMRSTQ
ncbi:hypothetical protein Y032_0541g3189 [Ancylostoma ceylanicum]|nr:hypothetical protein Y032_0541g3189 [Ancylostoma ceylanicum]